MLQLATSQDAPDAAIGLVPPRRLAHLVLRARAASGLSRTEVAARSAGRLSADDLAAIEQGERPLRDGELRFLAALFGVTVAQLVPRRVELVLDHHNGRIGSAGRWGYLSPLADESEILRRYLALVYVLRGVKPGRFIVPRAADLVVLGKVTGDKTEDVRLRLERCIRSERNALAALAMGFGRRVMVPGLGVMVAETANGDLVLTDQAASETGVAVPE